MQGKPYTLVTLTMGKQAPVPPVYVAGWVPNTGRSLWSEDKSVAPAGRRTTVTRSCSSQPSNSTDCTISADLIKFHLNIYTVIPRLTSEHANEFFG